MTCFSSNALQSCRRNQSACSMRNCALRGVLKCVHVALLSAGLCSAPVTGEHDDLSASQKTIFRRRGAARRHLSRRARDLVLDLLQRLAFGFRYAQEDEKQARKADCAVEPEGSRGFEPLNQHGEREGQKEARGP